MKKYAYKHTPIEFNFTQDAQRFHVQEIPLFKASGRGNFLYMHIKKYDLSTWRLIHVIKQATGADDRDVGYAGLKDKNATTSQFITIPKKYEPMLKNINTDRIDILSTDYTHLPIKVGQLKGNQFKIILKNIDNKNASEFEQIMEKISSDGFPNYFGYQRFGEDGKSWEQGKEIAHSAKRLKGAKEKLLVSSYQSHLFNSWLSHRVNISSIIASSNQDINKIVSALSYPAGLVTQLIKQPQFFKLFIGEMLSSYPYGKSTTCTDMLSSSHEFNKKILSPTGLLPGDRASRAYSDARHLEEPFDDDELLSLRGDRRFAWIWPENSTCNYDQDSQSLTVEFELPKGSYATSFLEEIAKRSLQPNRSRR